jgi:peptidoglycan/xylan/chitin deacetylase (PgdA/CDA1 family)
MKKINFKQSFGRASALLVALLSVAMLTPGIMQWAEAITAPRAQISFTFDDGLASHYKLAAPALQKHGYTGTAYVTTGCMGMTVVPNTCKADEQKAYMTWEEVTALRATYNWEIGSHTVTHPMLDSADPDLQPVQLTQEEIVRELTDSKNAITANTGVAPTAFASPFGDYDPQGQKVLAEAARLYTSHRGFHDYGYNYFPYNNYLLADLPVQSGATLRGDPAGSHVDVARVKQYIDQAVTDGRWLVLTFHDIVEGPAATGPDDFDFPVAELEQIAAYAKEKGIANTNVSDGLVSNPGGGNLLTNGSFNEAVNPVTPATPATTGTALWTTDDAANIKQDTTNRGNMPGSANTVALTSGATNTHLYSPAVAVQQKPYVVQMYLNVVQILTAGEIAFYVDEYDANGQYMGQTAKYTGSFYGGRATGNPALPIVQNNPLVRTFGFQYTPSAGATSARLQVVLVQNSGLVSYLDNIQWFAQDGSTKPAVIQPSADVNKDGLVNALDLSTVLTNWNKVGQTAAQGDVNNDGTVNALDLSAVLTNWSK